MTSRFTDNQKPRIIDSNNSERRDPLHNWAITRWLSRLDCGLLDDSSMDSFTDGFEPKDIFLVDSVLVEPKRADTGDINLSNDLKKFLKSRQDSFRFSRVLGQRDTTSTPDDVHRDSSYFTTSLPSVNYVLDLSQRDLDRSELIDDLLSQMSTGTSSDVLEWSEDALEVADSSVQEALLIALGERGFEHSDIDAVPLLVRNLRHAEIPRRVGATLGLEAYRLAPLAKYLFSAAEDEPLPYLSETELTIGRLLQQHGRRDWETDS